MEIITWNRPIEGLVHITEAWKDEQRGVDFGLKLVFDKQIEDLQNIVNSDSMDALVLMDGDRAVGYLCLTVVFNRMGNERWAQELYWYTLKGFRSKGGKMMERAAEYWARDKGCTHLLLSASNLASSMHDRMCRFYELLGFKKFETTFIKEL
jgi:GNAT superfamily N-acetyltransferase